jgi:hypothetical protein
VATPDFYISCPFSTPQPYFKPQNHNPTDNQVTINFVLKNPAYTNRRGSMLSSAVGNRSTGQSPNFPSDPKSPIEVDSREAASPSGATTTASAVKYGLDHSTDESKAAKWTALRIFARCHKITGWNSRTQLTNKIIAWAIERHLYDPEMDKEHQVLRLDPRATQTDDQMGQKDVGNSDGFFQSRP